MWTSVWNSLFIFAEFNYETMKPSWSFGFIRFFNMFKCVYNKSPKDSVITCRPVEKLDILDKQLVKQLERTHTISLLVINLVSYQYQHHYQLGVVLSLLVSSHFILISYCIVVVSHMWWPTHWKTIYSNPLPMQRYIERDSFIHWQWQLSNLIFSLPFWRGGEFI